MLGVLQPDGVQGELAGGSGGGVRSGVDLAAIGLVLAVCGATVGLLTSVGLYASGWDIRPQDRPEGHWQLIVGLGTAGLVVSALAIVTAALLVTLASTRCRTDRSLASLVNPAAVVLVAAAVGVFAALSGAPVIEHAEYLRTHPGMF